MARKHTTCRILFDDYSGNAHRVTVRVPSKVRLNNETLRRQAYNKTKVRVSQIQEVTCSGVRGELPIPNSIPVRNRKGHYYWAKKR